ncbi:MAG: calcium/proton exchanger [Chloroflexota bacterium]
MRRALSLNWLLVFVPVSIGAELAHQPVLAFVTSAIAIVPLAGLIGRSTDQLAIHVGPGLGGLLNASFGNLTDLLVGVFLLLAGEFDVLKASLIGSILGNLLLVLGLSFFVGGIGKSEQDFNARVAGVHSASLFLAISGLLVPVLLLFSSPKVEPGEKWILSLGVAATLMALYVAALVFMQFTHNHLFRTPGLDEKADWSRRRALAVLLGAALLVGLESEILVAGLEPTLARIKISPIFVGLILIPVIGNAAEHSSAVFFALKDKVDVTLEIAIGSSTQVALFVAPALVFVSLFLGRPMDFVFSVFQIGAVVVATLIVSLISADGRSNWLEGLQLLAVYFVIALAAFFL